MIGHSFCLPITCQDKHYMSQSSIRGHGLHDANCEGRKGLSRHDISNESKVVLMKSSKLDDS